ncbi:hypothetical protein GCM10009647_082210 [Streptomyces sanglieri]
MLHIASRCTYGVPRIHAELRRLDRRVNRFADPDDPVRAGRCEVVGTAGQRGRDPQHVTHRVGHDLHVHTVPGVLVGVVGPSVAGPVALRAGAVEQYVVRIALAQDFEQARSPVGEESDHAGCVGVGGADRDPEAGGYLREGVVLA